MSEITISGTAVETLEVCVDDIRDDVLDQTTEAQVCEHYGHEDLLDHMDEDIVRAWALRNLDLVEPEY